jgi:hypothetical protein
MPSSGSSESTLAQASIYSVAAATWSIRAGAARSLGWVAKCPHTTCRRTAE